MAGQKYSAVTLGGKPCLDPLALWHEARAQDPPLPLEPWFGRCNSFRCPFGREPGTGDLLMWREDLDALDSSQTQDLVFTDGDTKDAQTVTLRKLVLTGAACVSPGSPADPEAAYHVTVADRRDRFPGATIDQGYNVRKPDGSDYYTNTLNGGSPWTWNLMVKNIWNQVSGGGLTGLGPAPSLPFDPDGTPEGFTFYAADAWESLNFVLDRLGCAITFDPTSTKASLSAAYNPFQIVRVGTLDRPGVSLADAAAKQLIDSRLWDSEVVEADGHLIPAQVRVWFRRLPVPVDGTSPYYGITVTRATAWGGASQVPAGAKVATGTQAELYDDLYYCTATASAVTSRATQRAYDFYRITERYSRRSQVVYAGAVDVADGTPGQRLRHGSLCGLIAWEDRGAGTKFTRARKPWPQPWRPRTFGIPNAAACVSGIVTAVNCVDGVLTPTLKTLKIDWASQTASLVDTCP